MINKEARDYGKGFMFGCFDAIAWLVVLLILLNFALLAIRPIDDCDRSKFDRCDMKVLTDNKTGIEYLVTSKGGIVQRGNNPARAE